MPEPNNPGSTSTLSGREAERYLELNKMLFEFARLFDYSESSDRAVAIVGPAFLDTLGEEKVSGTVIDVEESVL